MAASYKPLSKFQGVWRVDGFSNFLITKRPATRIRVHFSLVTPESKNTPYAANSLVTEPGISNTLTLKTHVSRLRYFRVGTTWENGRRIGFPTVQDSFAVDTRAIKIFRFNDGQDIGGRFIRPMLPPAFFAMSEANQQALSQTWLIALPVIGHPLSSWLVLPASEVLSFYFGASSRLLAWVTSGEHRMHVHCPDDPGNRTVRLHSADTLSVRERQALARCYATQAGRDALREPHQHLSAVHNNNVGDQQIDTLVISSAFPFEGRTTLTVTGKRYVLDRNRNIWAFYGMRLLHCSQRADFDHLIVVNPGSNQGNEAEGGAGPLPPTYEAELLDKLQDEKDLAYFDTPADPRLRRIHAIEFAQPFSGFSHITTEVIHQGGGRQRHPKSDDMIEVDGFTHREGDGEGIGQGKQGEDVFEKDLVVARQLEDFLQVTDLLAARLKATRVWSLRYRPGKHGPAGGKVALFSRKLKRSKWHLVYDPVTNERQARQVVFAEIADTAEKQFFYLFEMQLDYQEVSGQRTLLAYLNGFSQMSDDQCETLLALTQINTRWPSRTSKWKSEAHQKQATAFFKIVNLDRLNHLKRELIPPNETERQTRERKKRHIVDWTNVLLDFIDDRIGVDPETERFVSLTRF